MTIVQQVLCSRPVSLEKLFKDAYEYYEVRMSKSDMVQALLDYEHLDEVPEPVADYCLEVLSNHIVYIRRK